MDDFGLPKPVNNEAMATAGLALLIAGLPPLASWFLWEWVKPFAKDVVETSRDFVPYAPRIGPSYREPDLPATGGLAGFFSTPSIAGVLIANHFCMADSDLLAFTFALFAGYFAAAVIVFLKIKSTFKTPTDQPRP
jgi:hypothetical protein